MFPEGEIIISDINAYIVTPDGSAKDIEGKSIFFSFERFKDEICKKGHCFVCGAPPSKEFNNEHIFPNWLLRQCGMHNETLTLPNGVRVKYGTYKILCCQTCNNQLAEVYETPISKTFCAGYDGVLEFVQNGGHHRLCAWLSLIFAKVHLRDFKNRVSLDERENEGVIGDNYELSELHHVHAVARAATVGVQVDEKVFGTLVILRLDPSEKDVAFDYCDNLEGRTLLLQVKDVAMIYVLDDCGATGGMLSEQLKKLPEPLSELQLREVYARHLAANMHIKKSPTFRTEFGGAKGNARISVELPELNIHDYEPTVFGKFFASALGNYSEAVIVDGKTGEEALEAIATGQVSFLFDEQGNIRNSKSR